MVASRRFFLGVLVFSFLGVVSGASADTSDRRTGLAIVYRAQNNPPLTEIWSGKALNDLLADLQMLSSTAPRGPVIRLDTEQLRRINVTSGRAGGHVGVFKHGRLFWPWALRRSYFKVKRDKLETLFARAASGSLDTDTVDAMDTAVSALHARLKAKVHVLEANEYIQSKRFLNQCEDAVRALKQPDANDYFTGKYAAQGQTVAELVEHMTRKGLRFAPAVGGDDSAYLALHRAVAQYSRAVHPVSSASLVKAPRKSQGVPKSRGPMTAPPAARAPYLWRLPAGRNVVRVRNPNPYAVVAGLRCGNAGLDLAIPAGGWATALVPDGHYQLYFKFADRPQALYQGDSFTLCGRSVEIRLVQVQGGNYGIRQVP